MPGKGERADIEDNEKIGDEFGKTWKDAEGERDSWRGICFYNAKGRPPGEVTACDGDRERHQDMRALARVQAGTYDSVSGGAAASYMHTRSIIHYRTTQITADSIPIGPGPCDVKIGQSKFDSGVHS